jgi:spore maturation protein A
MLNALWLGMIVLSLVSAILTGHTHELAASINEQAGFAFKMGLGLAGIMTFWLGLMRIAEQAGFVAWLGRVLKPAMRFLFPGVPEQDPAHGEIIMNLAATAMGLANASTPFGLRAMKALARLNPHKDTATDAMCMLLAINTSSVQLVPASAMGFLMLGGAINPGDIILTTLLATICSTVVAITAAHMCSKMKRYRTNALSTDSEECGS